MRIALHSTDRPRKLAKRLRARLSDAGILVNLHRSQGLVARMLGYRDWQELAACVGREGFALDDRDCGEATVQARRAHQAAALVEGGVPAPLAREIVEALHPSSVARPGTALDALGLRDWFDGGRAAVVDAAAFDRLMALPARLRDEARIHVVDLDSPLSSMDQIEGSLALGRPRLVIPAAAFPWPAPAKSLAAILAMGANIVLVDDGLMSGMRSVAKLREAARDGLLDGLRDVLSRVAPVEFIDLRAGQRDDPAGFPALGFTQPQAALLRAPHRHAGSLSLIAAPDGNGITTTLRRVMADRTDLGRSVVMVDDLPPTEFPGVVGIEWARPDRESFVRAVAKAAALSPDTLLVGGFRTPREFGAVASAAASGIAVWAQMVDMDVRSALLSVRDDLDVGRVTRPGPGALSKVVSQRLVSLLCRACNIGTDEATDLGIDTHRGATAAATFADDPDAIRYANPEGCPHCHRGRAHRTAVAEVLVPDDAFLDMLASGREDEAMAHWLAALGGTTMAENAAALMARGVISPNDVRTHFAPLSDIDPDRVRRSLREGPGAGSMG